MDPPGQQSDDDSSSEMEMSTPSPPASPLPAIATAPATAPAGMKRKLSETTETDSPGTDSLLEPAKKRKPSPASAVTKKPKPWLFPALWQRVFLHLPPASLARCLRVCKGFGVCLTQKAADVYGQDDCPSIDSDTIWIQSRKTFFPMLPKPLEGLTELQMLQLIGGLHCQFCNRQLPPSPASSPFNAGPGEHGLRVVWPFGIRTCGQCLENRIVKDVDVLTDPAYSRLRFGIPHGFLTTEKHFAADSVRYQVPGGIPANLRFAKIYYWPHLSMIKKVEEEAISLGEGAADEWRKGLINTGKAALADSARWEKWELQLLPRTDLVQVLREYDLSYPLYVQGMKSRSSGVNGAQPFPTANGAHPLPQPVHTFQNGYQTPIQASHHQFPPQHLPQPPLQHQAIQKKVRSTEEVEEMRQARRADIERRCQELEPPLEPKVLQHMDTFQAALQIPQAMTDSAWDMLKPRLLAQRESAELAEHKRASTLAALQAAIPSAIPDEMISKPGKDTYDREYQLAQEPLRRRLGEYADDYINGQWTGGKRLDKDSAPIFAANVLLQVRQRYLTDLNLGLLPLVETPKRADNSGQGTPPPDQFLSLDNMKWVFDNKVKPLTDPHRRELFLCVKCDEEKKPKWFAFEGLMQHCGARHYPEFGKGNIVVHWQTAEWPEDPPFHANPSHWLRTDRRTSEYKGQARVRNTPQGNREGPFPAPTPGARLPDNPYASQTNGQANGSSSHRSQAAQNGYFQQQLAEPQSVTDVVSEPQWKKFSTDAREVWDALDGVPSLEVCIRVRTALFHAALRYFHEFGEVASTDILADSLATHTLSVWKDAHRLACQSCVSDLDNAKSESYWVRIQGARLYNAQSLVRHYKLVHEQQLAEAGYTDWTAALIEAPDKQMLRELLRTPGMDDDKLALIAAVPPHVFPSPLPKIGVVPETTAASAGNNALSSRLLELTVKKTKSQPKKKDQRTPNGIEDRDESQEPLPEPTEDEYDPRRPMPVPLRQQGPSSAVSAPPTNGLSSLTPETLAVLQRLVSNNNGASQSMHVPERSRSPSVGRPEPPPASAIARPAAVTAPTGAPDIAAILAALTGQNAYPQSTTPAAAMNAGAGSTAGQPHQVRYEQQYMDLPPAGQEYSRPGSGYKQYQSHSDQAISNGVQELQAALTSNHRQFQQNRLPTYVEAPHAHSAQAQPRQQYVPESELRHGRPPVHQPQYRDVPVQYIQLPPAREYGGPREYAASREYAAPGHQYDRPHAQPIYVDRHGHRVELIPIDAAPAPVQYAPNPYEQQQHGRHQDQRYPPLAYEARRPVYHEEMPHGGKTAPQRYANGTYDPYDDRASVPRS